MDTIFCQQPHFPNQGGIDSFDTFTVENCIPQGRAPSLLLFAITINDLPVNSNVDINIFADDSCIWETGLDINKLAFNIQNSLLEVVRWCDTWGFRISFQIGYGSLYQTSENTVH